MKINLVSVEDGIDNIGFRKISAFKLKKIFTGSRKKRTDNFDRLSGNTRPVTDGFFQ